tara:strand:+ start:3965 stop:4414 length:450 start_codon:yes stop_codon:yes gene_type:complete
MAGFNGNFMCTSFKQELLEAKHNFSASGGNQFKLALYTQTGADKNASTSAYTTDGEVSGTNYTAKGNVLTNLAPSAGGTTGFANFVDLPFNNVTVSAVRGAIIFNETASGDPSVVVLDFVSPKSATAGTFTVDFPANTSTAAIIRIAGP